MLRCFKLVVCAGFRGHDPERNAFKYFLPLTCAYRHLPQLAQGLEVSSAAAVARLPSRPQWDHGSALHLGAVAAFARAGCRVSCLE